MKRRDWRDGVLDVSLRVASGGLLLRDELMGVTRRLRRCGLAEAIYFSSGDRKLAAVFVPGEAGLPVVLVCHGIGETVEHWSAVQALLRDAGVGSMVFDYSGYGRSSGRVSAAHCDEDFLAAYGELRRRVGDAVPVFVLGYSLGSGIAAAGIGLLKPAAAGLFLCEGFDSFKNAAGAVGLPGWMVRGYPDVWRTVDVVGGISVPVWVVHSTGDKLFPVSMARRVVDGSGGWAELLVVEGLGHNDPFLLAAECYWDPILRRMLGGTSAE